jgi:hypothetical protein
MKINFNHIGIRISSIVLATLILAMALLSA